MTTRPVLRLFALLLLLAAASEATYSPRSDTAADGSDDYSHDEGLPLSVRDAKILELLRRRDVLESTAMPAVEAFAVAQKHHSDVEASVPWLSWSRNAEDKARVRKAEAELAEARVAMETAVQAVHNVELQLKPLYGVTSPQLYREQRQQAKRSLQVVKDYAWWHSLFARYRAESLSELLLQIVLQYVVGLVMGYPIGFLHFMWKDAWLVAQYSDGALGTRALALGYYLLSCAVFLLPLVVLVGGFYVVVKNGDGIVRAFGGRSQGSWEADVAAQRRRIAQRPHYKY